MSAQRMQRLPVQTLVVGTNGSTAAIERARTALIVLAGLIISLSVIASTLPLLKRITGPGPKPPGTSEPPRHRRSMDVAAAVHDAPGGWHSKIMDQIW